MKSATVLLCIRTCAQRWILLLGAGNAVVASFETLSLKLMFDILMIVESTAVLISALRSRETTSTWPSLADRICYWRGCGRGRGPCGRRCRLGYWWYGWDVGCG